MPQRITLLTHGDVVEACVEPSIAELEAQMARVVPSSTLGVRTAATTLYDCLYVARKLSRRTYTRYSRRVKTRRCPPPTWAPNTESPRRLAGSPPAGITPPPSLPRRYTLSMLPSPTECRLQPSYSEPRHCRRCTCSQPAHASWQAGPPDRLGGAPTAPQCARSAPQCARSVPAVCPISLSGDRRSACRGGE